MRHTRVLWMGWLGVLILAAWVYWRHEEEERLSRDVTAERALRARYESRVDVLRNASKAARNSANRRPPNAKVIDHGQTEKAKRLEQLRGALVAHLAIAPPTKSEPPIPPPSGRQGIIFAELMREPEYERSVADWTRLSMEMQYAPLFAQVSLDDARLEKLKLLLLDQMLVTWDLDLVAERHGLKVSDDPALKGRVVGELQRVFVNELRALLGDSGVARLQEFQRSRGPREIADAFATRMSYSNEPLTTDQLRQLVTVFEGLRGWHPGMRSGGITPIPGERMAQAKLVLTPNQFSQLELFRAEHAASKLDPRGKSSR